MIFLLAALSCWACWLPPGIHAQEPRHLVTYEEAYAGLAPLAASPEVPANRSMVQDAFTGGRVYCGYQGWFSCPGDGSETGWTHYQGVDGKFEPGHCSIDLWPDVSELSEAEKFKTLFRHADGSQAHVFSSQNAATVVRHFRWMAEYGIDGAFVQRFANAASPHLSDYRQLRRTNRVLLNCRAAANAHGRAWALMYDLSGMGDADMDRVYADWKHLRTQMNLGLDPADRAYLYHLGKPLVAVWGIGFSDSDGKTRPTLEKQAEFLRLLKHNPDWGGFSIMIGVPTGWRSGDRDATANPTLLEEIAKLADVISPWTVGRYSTPEEARRHRQRDWEPDLAWCAERNTSYLPVVFPGFSWRNLHQGGEPLGQIPRLGGKFLWEQFIQARASGAEAVYVAMFDEMDEGTAIFKCTNEPPTGEAGAGGSEFLTHEGLPSDFYLRLCGEGGRLLRGEVLGR